MKADFDKYYTNKSDVVTICEIINELIEDKSDCEIIEPSAGDGRIVLELIKHGFDCKGYDIMPDNDFIIKQDFLTLQLEPTTKYRAFVGNPPFGKGCSDAIKFFNKCAELDADMIAFIIPASFGHKLQMRSRLDDNFSLYSSYDLNNKHFERIDGHDYIGTSRLQCKFMVFVRHKREPVVIPEPKEYSIVRPKNNKVTENNVQKELPVGDIDVDFTIITHGTKAGKTEDFDGSVQKVSVRQFVKVKAGFDVDKVREKFDNADYSYFIESAAFKGSQSSLNGDEFICCVENSNYKLVELIKTGYDIKNHKKQKQTNLDVLFSV